MSIIKNSIKRVIGAAASITFLSLVVSGNCCAQSINESVNYKYPLDVTMSLSGNYGELRPNHFHSGIDYRVGGVIGAPVYATADGYISRISISPTGYGNALYVTHNNGEVSVYGHLDRYVKKIKDFVLQKQYESESFVQDITLTPTDFPVKQGEQIANAGNTGSSGGPHLHFEIRDINNKPMDVLNRGLIPIEINAKPIINNVVFYGFNESNGVTKCAYVAQRTAPSGVVSVPSEFYLAIDAVGKIETSWAKLAISEYKVFLDDTLVFHFNLGETPIENSRYMNSLVEYRQYAIKRKLLIKTYVEPGNLLRDKISSFNRGVIKLTDSDTHKVRVEVKDFAENSIAKVYNVKLDKSLDSKLFVQDSVKRDNYMAWYLPGFYSTKGLDVTLPQGTLYSSIYFTADTSKTRVTPYAPVWNLYNGVTPLHKGMEVEMECNIPEDLIDKSFMGIVSGSRIYYAGGKYDAAKKRMVATVGSFGSYSVGVDLDEPHITPSFIENSVINSDYITFIISDNLSGIKSYRVEIDGMWVLAKFDSKTRRLTVPLLDSPIESGTKHNLVIKVVDNVGNEAVLERAFRW